MGVPSFYRWLVGRYPNTVVSAMDEGEGCACDDPNPNGEFDNLYLDMNGIIHPCFHPDDELFGPSTVDEVFDAIFKYIDCLFRIVRPRKLLYMAVDGVAPRAKMNQQRTRRFRAAKDAEIAEKEEERLRREYENEGKELLPKLEYSELSDSNVITPGTLFMQKLSKALEYYIRLKLNNDPYWKSIMVILSDANVPGEGEHKIMSFIRMQRRLPGYNPNTRHCLYGLDADLIMLALATHEIHFCVLREDVLKQDQQEISLSKFTANSSQKDLENFKSRERYKKSETVYKCIRKKPYQFLNIWILREYLELDMKPRYDADIERIVDDFIFICFFTGNDFLPHLPSIEIHESGIDLLIFVYKKTFKLMGDYLINTSNITKKNTAYINFKGFRIFMMEVSLYENRIFEKRCMLRQKKLQRLLQEREKDENDQFIFGDSDFNIKQDNVNSFSKKCNTSSSQAMEDSCSVQFDALENTKELRQKIKQFLRDKADLFKNEVLENDKVKLGCPGWKTRYYKEKFPAENAKEVEAIRKLLVKKYVEGLCWVLQYYFTGICSWSWYYPFYYAPFASDFKDLSCVELSFAIGRPFRPFDQLMAVLPPRSSHALPKAYRSLMNDDNSPIIEFYPNDFAVDNDGKRYAWQGVCKLPFIEEERLLGATKEPFKELQPDEIERNCVNSDKVFVKDSSSLVKKTSLQHQASENHPKESQNHDAVVPSFAINGLLSFCEESSVPLKFTSPILGMKDIPNDRSRCATLIKQEQPQSHTPRPPDGVKIPEKTITDSDIVERMLWHEYPGHFPPQQLRQRDVQTPPASANETRKGAGEGWGSMGRGKLLLDSPLANPDPDSTTAGKEIWKGAGEYPVDLGQSLVGLSEQTYKGAGEEWGGRGRGKLLVDQTLMGSGKDRWKGAGEGFANVGRGKLLMDRTLVVSSEHKPSPILPATHLTHLNKVTGSNMNTHGWGEYSATATSSPSNFYENIRQMDERLAANRTDNWKGAGEYPVDGREKLPVGQSLAGPSEQTYKGEGEGWGGRGRGKLLVDQALMGSGKDRWKSAGEGFANVGRGKLLMDRTLAVSSMENKPSPILPATHLNKVTGSNMNNHGWREYSAAATFSTLNLNFRQMDERSAANRTFSTLNLNLRQMDERSAANRTDNWRERSAPMVSTYGRGGGRIRPPLNSHGGRGRGVYQNFTWVERKPE